MKIYIAHSKSIDYKNDLYKPIQESSLFIENEIIFPHQKSDDSNNTREFYKTIDLVIAECSMPATGLGIELGWLYDDNKIIYCIYKKGNKLSSSIKTITNKIFEYENKNDMLDIINKIVKGEI